MSSASVTRDAKIVLAVVIGLIIAAVLVLSLTGHPVPGSVTAALVAAVGTLGGVSVPAGATAAVQAAETSLTKLVPAADELTGLRKDVNDALAAARAHLPADALDELLGRVSKLEAAAVPLPAPAPPPAPDYDTPPAAVVPDPGPPTQPIPATLPNDVAGSPLPAPLPPAAS